MDFTLKSYSNLLKAFLNAGYSFVSSPLGAPDSKCVFLRHDVDKKPLNSLATARLEAELGICATYYFRAVPCSWDEAVIREISNLGHSIGYHYECMTTSGGDPAAAYSDFTANLQRLRELVPVRSICMHGSPRSPWDSRDLWRSYDYKSLGLDFEPYLDTDFSEWFYLTDTGRRWDGFAVSVRDKIPQWQDRWAEAGLTFHTTPDIIERLESMPQRIMVTTHPQRWMNFGPGYIWELMLQNAKNVVKKLLARAK